MHAVGSKITAEAFASAVIVSALGGTASHIETLSFMLADRMEPVLVLKLLDDLSRGR